MTSKKRATLLAVTLLAMTMLGAAAVYTGTAAATPSQGLTTKILAQSTLGSLDLDAHAHLPGTPRWRIDLDTAGLTDGYVVDNVIAPGGTTGWHTHPGPSLVFVIRGAVTNYTTDGRSCNAHVYQAGSAFTDAGGKDVHTLVNNGTADAETIAVQLLPHTADRKTDAPAPADCQP